MTTALDLIDEWARATRGSWSRFDGRMAQSTLNELTGIARDLPGDLPTPIVAILREHADLCPIGGGHWREFCDWGPWRPDGLPSCDPMERS